MKWTTLLAAAGMLLAAGCTSKQTAGSAEADPTPPTSASAPAASGFKSRAAGTATELSSTNLTVKSKPAAKRSPFPSSAAPAPTAEADDSQADTAEEVATQAEIRPEDVPQEGDQILVAPQFLGALLPGVDLSKVERSEPLNIKSLLEGQGIEITNYQQLVEMGVTNYQILRAPKPSEKQDQTSEQKK